jgi:hypothetical protein
MVPSVHFLELPRRFTAADVAAAVHGTTPRAALAIAANAYSLGKLVNDVEFADAYVRQLLAAVADAMLPSRGERDDAHGHGLPAVCLEVGADDWASRCEAEGCEVNAPMVVHV